MAGHHHRGFRHHLHHRALHHRNLRLQGGRTGEPYHDGARAGVEPYHQIFVMVLLCPSSEFCVPLVLPVTVLRYCTERLLRWGCCASQMSLYVSSSTVDCALVGFPPYLPLDCKVLLPWTCRLVKSTSRLLWCFEVLSWHTRYGYVPGICCWFGMAWHGMLPVGCFSLTSIARKEFRDGAIVPFE